MSEDKGFLSRWSDRKLRPESDDADAALPTSEEAKPIEDEFEGKSDEEILSILELPEPDTLKLGDTVEKFMDGRVPERIRARALRAFWKTNPLLANIDGLDEYCDDYTDAAMVVENLQTIYEVGKGYAAQALDTLESLADEDTSTDEELGSAVVGQVDTRLENEEPADSEEIFAESDTPDQGATPQNNLSLLNNDILEEEVTIVPRPRRMRFDTP